VFDRPEYSRIKYSAGRDCSFAIHRMAALTDGCLGPSSGTSGSTRVELRVACFGS
jgi:hypothetical protein